MKDQQDDTVPEAGKPPKQYYNRQRIRLSLMHYLLGRGVSSIANFLVVFLIIRSLSVESYAVYTTFTGLIILTMSFSSGGLERVVPRYLPVLREGGAEQDLRRLTWRLLMWRMVFLAIVLVPIVVFEDYLSELFSIPDDRWAVWGLYAYMVAYAVSVHLTRSLQALLLQREATVALSIEWFSKLVVLGSLWGLAGSFDLAQVMWANAITIGLGAGYMFLNLAKDLRKHAERDKEKQPSVTRAEVWDTGWHNYCQRLIGTANSPGANRLLCRYMLDTAATAGFGFALAVYGIIQRFAPATLLLGLVEPSVMARYSESKDFSVLQSSASVIVKFSLFILAPAAAWFFFAGHPVTAFVTADKYTEMTWMIAGMMVALMFASNRSMLTLIANAVNESSSLVRATAWANALLPMHVLLIWWLGLPGLLAGILFIAWFTNFYLVRRLRHIGYDYRVDFRSLTQIVLFAIVAGAAGGLIPHFVGPSLVTSVAAACVTGLLFLGATFVWKPFTEEERKLMNGYIGKKVFIW